MQYRNLKEGNRFIGSDMEYSQDNIKEKYFQECILHDSIKPGL